MKIVSAIAIRDFKSLVVSPMFLFIAAVCTCLWSYIYLRSILMFSTLSMNAQVADGAYGVLNLHFGVIVTHLKYVNIVLLFAVPALTMRLFAEEKKERSFDLLMSAPISGREIAFGKFLAGLGGSLVLILISSFYPLLTSLFGEVQWAILGSAYLGFSLVCGIYVAIGLFCSSLSSSVFLSVTLGVLLNFGIWFLGLGEGFSDSPRIATVLDHISVVQHLTQFTKGNLGLSSLVFFFTGILLFVFFTERSIESSRWGA